MNRNELRNQRAQRDHRFNLWWWCFFLFGCFGAFVSTVAADGVTMSPWLIVGGLIGMIAGRRQHARRIAQADALADEQAARAEAAEAAMAREAKRAAEQRARAGQGDGQQKPPRP